MINKVWVWARIVLLLVLICGVVAGAVLVSRPHPSISEHYGAEHRNALYVREHHCTIDGSKPTHRQWSEYYGKEAVEVGYKMYTCPGFDRGESILIYDNQEQP